MTDVADLVSRLESGQTIEEIGRQLLPATVQRTVRTCATVPVVEPELYASVLRPRSGPDAPALAELAGRGLVEPVGDIGERWRVPRDAAAGWMQEWQQDPAELEDLEAAIAAWYEARGDVAEQARHLLLADTARALGLFRDLLTEADSARDFARYQDLLDILGDPLRSTRAGPEAAELHSERTGHLGAQLYWSGDYRRSAQFLEPQHLRYRTERLLAPSGSRVWQLWAPGGTGKTIQLQWLVARTAVPRGIPCARIDFDIVDPVNVARYPWLLLLEVAEQLDHRWPRRVFERLDRYASYRSLATGRTSDLTRSAAKNLNSLDIRQLEQNILSIFIRRFNTAAGDEPVLIVVDTLEEVLLGGSGQIDPLLALLARVLRECPSLRLVLAGRYDLRKRAPKAVPWLGPVVHIGLKDFTPEQAETYLRDIRGIPDPAMWSAILRQTRRHPLLMALFADLVDDDPELRPEQLANTTEPALLLLIDRVIRRIADPYVRWLVRYGVIPRRLLTVGEMTTLVGPFLARTIAGPCALDDPRAGIDTDVPADVFPFAEPPDAATLADAWERLRSYAAGASWVSEPAGDGTAVVFHRNVREPMRKLIAAQPVFRELHGAFRSRFEELAAPTSAARVDHLREAVYHAFQMADPHVAEFWRGQIRAVRATGDLDGVRALASDLLSEDYLTADGDPLRRGDGALLLRYEVIAEASAWLAHVAVELARAEDAGPSDPLWSQAGMAIFRARTARQAVNAAPSAVEVAAGAAVLVANGDPGGAATMVSTALPTAVQGDRAELLRSLGDAQAALGDSRATDIYREALTSADAGGMADQSAELAVLLAERAEARDRLDEAVAWCQRAIDSGLRVRAAAKARLLLGRLRLSCFLPDATLQVLAQAWPNPADRITAGRLRAQAHLMIGRGGRALDELDAATDLLTALPEPAASTHLAHILQLRATVLAELLSVDEANDTYLRAAALWSELGYVDGQPECSYLYLRFLVRTVGDLAAAARFTVRPVTGLGPLATPWAELVAEINAAGVRPVEQPPSDEEPSPLQFARTAAWRLARSWQQARSLLPRLTQALGQVQPPSARLVVLEELRRCAGPVPAADIALLRPMFDDVGREGHRTDRRLQRQLLGELERLAGDGARAAGLVDAPLPDMEPESGTLVARRRWLAARARAGEPFDPTDVVRPLLNPALDHPLLRAETLLTLANLPSAGEARPLLLARARAACLTVTQPSRCAADILRTEGALTGEESLLGQADDLYRRLGVRLATGRPGAVPILSDRPGEVHLGLRRPEGVPGDLVALQRELVEDWPGFATALGGVLSAGPALRGPSTLRYESDDLMVQALPWELAAAVGGQPDYPGRVVYRSLPVAANRLDVAWLQRALRAAGHTLDVDGVVGPVTDGALRSFAGRGVPVEPDDRERLGSRLPGDPTKWLVVVVRPDMYTESRVASHGDSGFDVADSYYRHGLRVRVADHRELLDSGGLLESAAVVHITARLDMRGTDPYFDFSQATTPERLKSKGLGADVRPRDVTRWLRACDPERAPLVVLDPPSPGSPHDVPWQLVLRNLFAASLFADGGAPAIIATGLRSTGPRYVDVIAGGLVRGDSLASIATEMRPPGWEPTRFLRWAGDSDELAARATAIFAAPSHFTV